MDVIIYQAPGRIGKIRSFGNCKPQGHVAQNKQHKPDKKQKILLDINRGYNNVSKKIDDVNRGNHAEIVGVTSQNR